MQARFRGAAASVAVLVAVGAAATAGATTIVERDVPVQIGAERVTLVEGLEHPWGKTWLPDGTMLVTERPGRLRIIRDGELVEEPVAGVPEVFAEGQGGLLDVSAHPEFAANDLIYLTYAHGDAEANQTRVARARFDGAALSDLEVLFEVDQPKTGSQHFGSRLAWLPDGTLLVSIGDGGNPPTMLDGELIRERAQDLGSHIGKVLRLNDDGSVPDDNPFVDSEGAQPEIWSYGHRNIQGIAVHPETGAVWVNEHGSLGGDEVNFVEPGQNYGWPLVTYSVEYVDGAEISPHQTLEGMTDPALVWQIATAPSGLMLYTGTAFPEWQGHLFSGGLISQDVRRLEFDPEGNLVDQRALRVGQRVRDVSQGPDGLIYVLTDQPMGRLVRFEPAS